LNKSDHACLAVGRMPLAIGSAGSLAVVDILMRSAMIREVL
jgi:hypothetical protein